MVIFGSFFERLKVYEKNYLYEIDKNYKMYRKEISLNSEKRCNNDDDFLKSSIS